MKTLRNLAMLCGLILIGGCATSDPCGWAQPIRPSVADVLTEGTARQLLNHNETGARVCGWNR
jgi:hypothetical protein